jgi:hypothetical protein
MFKDFQFFNLSEVMVAILNVFQGNQTQIWKTIQSVSHPSLVQFSPVVLEKKNQNVKS